MINEEDFEVNSLVRYEKSMSMVGLVDNTDLSNYDNN